MAEFEGIYANAVDPVSLKQVIGDGTGKRIEWHKRVAGVDTAVATLSDAGAIMVATAMRVAAFTAGTVVSDASGNFSVSAGGGTVTLAGDVTGVSSANTVVGLTGTAGTIALHGTILASDAVTSGGGRNLSVLAGNTTDVAGSGGNLVLSSGTGPLGNGDVTLRSGGAAGLVIVASSPSPIVHFPGSDVRWAENSTPVLFQAARTSDAAVHALSFQSQDFYPSAVTNVLPGNMAFTLGAGMPVVTFVASSPQPIVHFYGNTIRWREAASPILTQQQRSSDSGVPQPLRFRSQDPYSGATNHGVGNDARIAGNIEWEIGTSVNGADQLGHYVWSIAETAVMKAWTDRLELYDIAIRFIYNASAPTIDVADPAAGAGAPITIIAQRGFDDRGGDVIVKGGPGGGGTDGGGFIAQVGNVGQPQIQAQQLGSKYVVAFGMPTILTVSDIPASNSNYMLIGDAYNVDDIDGNVGPVGASLIASWAGRPVLQCSDGNWIRFDGTVHSGPVGAVLAYVDVTLSGNPYCLELFDRSP